MGSSIPLCTISPKLAFRLTSDWVLKKVEEVQECLGISCVGFEEQLKALLIAIEARRSKALKSTVKRDRELNCLKSFINYDNEGSVGRYRLKGRGARSSKKA